MDTTMTSTGHTESTDRPGTTDRTDRTDRAVRGLRQLRHPVVFGGLIGVVGGAAFLFGGAAGLPADVQGAVRALAVALTAFALVAVLLRRRHLPDGQPPQRGAMRVYWIAVGAMLLLFPVTRLIAQALDAPTMQIALIAAVVGLHFLPFARAFDAPVFWWIGGAMAALGLAGAALAAAGMPAAGPAGAAAAGAAMLVIVAGQALLQGRHVR